MAEVLYIHIHVPTTNVSGYFQDSRETEVLVATFWRRPFEPMKPERFFACNSVFSNADAASALHASAFSSSLYEGSSLVSLKVLCPLHHGDTPHSLFDIALNAFNDSDGVTLLLTKHLRLPSPKRRG